MTSRCDYVSRFFGVVCSQKKSKKLKVVFFYYLEYDLKDTTPIPPFLVPRIFLVNKKFESTVGT